MRTPPLSQQASDRVRGFVPPAVEARPAATIVVVRDGHQGLETYLMRRQTSMAFAGGRYVFPGGGLSESDFEAVPWVGPDAAYWAGRFSCDQRRAHAMVVAAVRETFEETGVLLAGPDEHTVVSDTTGDAFQAAREEVEQGRLGFADFLRSRGLALRADLLGAWAHWITPKFQPRRYDTLFFVAALPAGQTVGAMSREADLAGWTPIRHIIGEVEQGRAKMMPPTITTCRDLVDLSADDVLEAAATRRIHTIEPEPVEVDGRVHLDIDVDGPR